MSRTDIPLRIVLALIAFVTISSALADSPRATAVLTESKVGVGETVHLQIRVVNGAGAKPPQEIQADGLQINYTGEAQESHITFGAGGIRTTMSMTYDYTVLSLRPGTFKIPPQIIRVGSASLRTEELTLYVVDRPGGGNRNARSAQSNGEAIKPWAEVSIPKKEAYVGEVIEAQVQIGIDAIARINPQQLLVGPELKAQGFTVRKWERPQETMRVVNGRQERVFIYKTTLTAAKSGHFDIPAELQLEMRWPARAVQPRRRLAPGDMDNLQDLLEEMQEMMPDPRSQYTPPEVVTIRSEPTALQVKPLPANAPPSFSGAVGNFNMTVDANPKNVQIGDPITVTSTIGGRGNFDRVTGPVLEDERGWHKYPPSSKFKQDDDVGISGTKAFEMVLSPNEKKQSIPPFVFSYFDPAKENYVTLRNDTIPIQVEGGATVAAAPAASAAPAAAATQTSSPAARPTPKPQDILYQLTERPARAQSFTPLYARPNFWFAQIIPFLALLGLIGWKARQSRLDNREAQRIAALHHEAAELVRKLRRDDSSPQTYFSQAARAVQVKTALASRHGGIDPNMVDAETAATTFQLDENSRDQLRRLFERSDELRYSGTHNGTEKISPEHRREVLNLVESLRA